MSRDEQPANDARLPRDGLPRLDGAAPRESSRTRRPPRIGLALGSGGARGWAHVGVLQCLRDLGVPVHCVAGTSIGSIIGAAYAAGRLDALERFAAQLDWRRLAGLFVEASFPRAGLVTGRRIQDLLREIVGIRQIEDLPIPFSAVAANLHTGEPVVFSRGNVVEALRASIAIPGIFVPALHAGRHLIDGGITNPLPVDVAEAMGAEVVIAVDVNLAPGRGHEPAAAPRDPRADGAGTAHRLPGQPHSSLRDVMADVLRNGRQRKTPDLSIFHVLTRTVRIAENQITQSRLRLHPPAILIQPAVGDLDTLEFHRAAQAIAAGRAAADAASGQLRRLLERDDAP